MISCRIGRTKTKVPLILINLVLSTDVVSEGESKNVGVDGVRAGGTRSITALCRNVGTLVQCT